MTSERATCDTCRWWVFLSNGVFGRGQRRIGSCHIRAVPDDFPLRLPDDWCGEHQPREVADE